MARVRDRMLIMAQADNADAEPPDKKKDVINGLYWIDPHNFDELLLRGVSWKLSGPPEARKMKRRTVDELEMGNLLRLDNYDGTEYDAPELHDLSEFMQKIVQEAGFTVPTVEGFNNGQVFNDLDKKVYFSKESRRHKYNGRKPGARGPSKSSANEAEDDEDSFDSEDLNDDPESDADSDVEAVPSRHRKRSPNEERREPPGWWEYFAELTKWPAAMIARINPNSCLMTIGHPFAYCEHCHFHHPPSRYSQCWMLLEQLEKPDLIPLADGSEEIDDEAPPKSAVHGEGRNSRKRKAADVSEEDEGTDTRFGKAQKIDEVRPTERVQRANQANSS